MSPDSRLSAQQHETPRERSSARPDDCGPQSPAGRATGPRATQCHTAQARCGERYLTLLCLLAVAYWGISLRNLSVTPAVYEDEPWLASTGWKLATEGVFGSDVFAGVYGMERHYYDFMPAFPLLLAATFRGLGVGLFQSRLLVVSLGLLTLALTFALARRLFKDERCGLLAVLLLLTVQSSGLTVTDVTGILFLDMARIARYDMLVPVFGLAALHAYISARQGRSLYFGLAGALAGLSGLAHIYGVFWLPVLLLLVLWDARRTPQAGDNAVHGQSHPWLPAAAWLLFGFALAWIPYLAYVLAGIEDWRGQTSWYAGRFDLLSIRWYLDNVRQELHRYGPGLGPLRPQILLRIGLWTVVVALPLSLIALGLRARRAAGQPERVILVPALAFPILFALLIRPKLVNYAVAFVPIAALAVAWGTLRFWLWLRGRAWLQYGRIVLAAVLVAIVFEGGTRVVAMNAASATMTPYTTLIRNVRRYLPPGSRVLGLHNYWFGLQDYDFRSFLAPLVWSGSTYRPRPLSFDEALDQVAPDVVLVDGRMQAYFEELRLGGDARPQLFFRWLDNHDARMAAIIDDPTYGEMRIYLLAPARSSASSRAEATISPSVIQNSK